MRSTNIPWWRHRFGLEHRKPMLQSLSMRRQKTLSSNRAETRPGRVSWRSWPGPELSVPLEHLDAGMLLHLRQRKRKEWPAPVEPLGRRGGGPSSQGLLSHWTLVPFFLSAPLNFFCAGILKLALGAALGVVEGVVWGAVGNGGWGLGWARWRVWRVVPWGRVLGAVEGVLGGVVWGAVGVGAGSRGGGGWWGGTGRRGGGCWEPWRGRLVGWCGAPWGWVLGAAEGWWRDGTGCRGREGAGEPRRGRAGAPVGSDKPPLSPPPRALFTEANLTSKRNVNMVKCMPIQRGRLKIRDRKHSSY